MNYILRHRLTAEDIEFLLTTTINYELFNPSVTGNDSGWCDYTTGSRIVTGGDRVIFFNVSAAETTLLTLKFQDRLKRLTLGLDEIYNEAQAHNAPPLSVIDSETVI